MSYDNSFVKNENKGMLWGLLQDSNIFDGIGNEKFTKVQELFEDCIRYININNPTLSLLEKNKMTMETMLKKISDEKNKPKRNIQMIYKAEDIQHKREEEFIIKLKEQQDSMNMMMNPTKPKEVSFSDDSSGYDKPIGDEMDRLIAERLASRERELEIPAITKETEVWLNTNANNANISLNEKKVSFNINPINSTTNENTIQNSIFNKLKRKTNDIQSNDIQSKVKTLHETTNIQNEIKILKKNQENILLVCSQILSILQDTNNK